MTDDERRDLIIYRMEKAWSSLTQVDHLIGQNYWNLATNRMYFGCYYAVTAILIKEGYHASSHKGVRNKFDEHFIKTGKISEKLGRTFSKLFQNGQAGDYTDFFDNTEKFVLEIGPETEELIQQITLLIKEQ